MDLPGTSTAPAAEPTNQNAANSATSATPSTSPKANVKASAKSSAKSTTKSTPATKAAAANSTLTQTPAANTPAATPTPVKTTAAPAAKSVSGTFTGDSINVRYGYVQVKITVENGKITEAQAVQAPSGRNDRWTQMAVPILRQQTLKAQSANINGASGASFTSYGWYTSLVSALAKAGM
jgi:uncharacterized protein with FMN-binding domain